MPVRLRHSAGPARPGAVASGRAVSVVLRAGRRVQLAASYGMIINPGLRVLSVRVLAVTGGAAHPTSVRLAGHPALRAGNVISLPASTVLPGGVFERVRAASQQRNTTTVVLGRVSLFSVVPVATFDVPLQIGAPAHAAVARPSLALVPSCGPSIGSAAGFYRTIRNARFSGGWNTISILGKHIPIGLSLSTDFDLVAGVNDLQGVTLGLSCEVEIPFQTVVAGIPVTGAAFGNVHGSVGGGVGFQAQLGLHVHAGVSTIGVPPRLLFAPQVKFSHPTAKVNAAATVAVTAGFGAGVKVGLGSIVGNADATLNFNNDWDFSAQASIPKGPGEPADPGKRHRRRSAQL